MPRKFEVTPDVLEQMKQCLSLNQATGALTWLIKPGGKRQLGDRAGSNANNGYRILTFRRCHYYEHRLIWLWLYGAIPADKVIDHINGDPSDNRPANLRLVSQMANTQNVVRKGARKAATGETLPQGVHWVAKSGRYSACIKVNYRKIHLGTFDSPGQAHAAYLHAKSQSHPASTIERLI